MRNTKILCTLGPASSSPDVIDGLLEAGMDAVRLNFSHGEREQHARNIERVREASRRHDRITPIVADLQGPKIRTGRLQGGGPVELKAGTFLRLTARPILGDSRTMSLD